MFYRIILRSCCPIIRYPVRLNVARCCLTSKLIVRTSFRSLKDKNKPGEFVELGSFPEPPDQFRDKSCDHLLPMARATEMNNYISKTFDYKSFNLMPALITEIRSLGIERFAFVKGHLGTKFSYVEFLVFSEYLFSRVLSNGISHMDSKELGIIFSEKALKAIRSIPKQSDDCPIFDGNNIYYLGITSHGLVDVDNGNYEAKENTVSKVKRELILHVSITYLKNGAEIRQAMKLERRKLTLLDSVSVILKPIWLRNREQACLEKYVEELRKLEKKLATKYKKSEISEKVKKEARRQLTKEYLDGVYYKSFDERNPTTWMKSKRDLFEKEMALLDRHRTTTLVLSRRLGEPEDSEWHVLDLITHDKPFHNYSDEK